MRFAARASDFGALAMTDPRQDDLFEGAFGRRKPRAPE
jgi:hypothetical protein